jgi:ppGpp synthetase/RelA/SpoT-type nucleotidyltranferase
VKFDKKRYKGLLSDFDLDGLPNVDDPDPFGNQDKQSIEQVKFSNTFNKVLDTKKNLDVELDKFVTKLRNSTTSTEKIYARTKTPFSILNKLVDSRLLDEKRGLKDLVGATITFKNLQDLERYMQKVVRGDLGKVIDFDDFYKNPNDGYRAYHFIVEQDGIPIELQLKTDRMKEVNILSHEAYKNKTLNKEYMLYLTTLADNADKGSKTAQDQFAEIMQNKGNVRKSLSVKNN